LKPLIDSVRVRLHEGEADVAVRLHVKCVHPRLRVLSAQWDPYIKPGVPKNPDGSVGLDASTPRMTDGTPDLSGAWLTIRGTPEGTLDPQGTFGESSRHNPFSNIGMVVKGSPPHSVWSSTSQTTCGGKLHR
jgi:hypothetical protein